MNSRVLVVDDQEQIHDDFREMLLPRRATAASDDLAAAFMEAPVRVAGLPFSLDLRHARTGEEGYAAVKQAHEHDEPIAVAFVDVRMPPGIDGIEAVRRMRDVDRNLEVVIMTAYSDKLEMATEKGTPVAT